MKKVLLLCASFLLAAGVAQASTITYEADYVTLSGQSCLRSFCFPDTTLSPFSKTFILTSAQLAADGSYDVLASLNPSFGSAPATPPGGSVSFQAQADAIVSGGKVVDLKLKYFLSVSGPIPLLGGSSSSSNSLNASAGNWNSSSSSSSFFGGGGGSSSSGNEQGTYTIREISRVADVPEPNTPILFAAGLIACGLFSGLRRHGLKA